jgi:drug/metabolite transporter (DMT)-like permease
VAESTRDRSAAAPAGRRDSGPLLTVAAVAFTVFCWAAAFVGIRDAVRDMSPGSIALVRYTVASVVLAGMLAATRRPLPDRRDWPRLALVGVLGIAVYNLALNYGSQFVHAGSAAFLVNTAPIFTAIFAVTMLGEQVTKLAFAGMVLSFGGAMLISLGEGKEVSFEPGALLILLAALAFSLFFITQKPLLAKYTPIQVITVAVWVGTVLMVPFSLDVGSEVAGAPGSALWVVVLLGVFPGALAYASWAYVLSKIPAAKAGSFIYIVGPTTVLIAWVWLGEVPAALSLLGGLIALAGVVIVNTWGRSPAPGKS